MEVSVRSIGGSGIDKRAESDLSQGHRYLSFIVAVKLPSTQLLINNVGHEEGHQCPKLVSMVDKVYQDLPYMF